ncbi:DUF3060 domain-containing protein [Xanthomonas sp. NCPPB 2654]|uniref:DUF3060 domain-containing protein n=1 Tax=unclassified Xanthomonas TaxID=2643310 RepID=UPI0021E00C4B|nr:MULTISPECIES: DUF3060 domain-containing protein [unclassified Xanthomonas]MDL5367262.1 DUF3060 domain-containing protein [Xanthomonas sp. NCPPB 2654]UYC18979.1 DUF3060 domain-containing protein [Xanthomonas sp. CFBP 8443]
MTRNLFLCLPLLALSACAQQQAPAGGEPAAGTPAPAAAPAATAPPAAAAPSAPTAATAPASAAQAGGENGERATLMVTSTAGTIDCDGHNLDIVGSGAKLVLRGQCATVALLGDNGSLQIEHADGVRVVGNNAQVVMTSDTKEVELFGRHGNLQMRRIDTLTVTGNENQLRATSLGAVTLQGDKNELTQQSGTAKVQDYGRDNRIAGN